MIAPRWRKVFKDLLRQKARTLLVILTIAVGVFAVGFVANTFIAIMNDMAADYQSVNPHAARIFTDPFNADLLHSLQNVPGVGTLEGRSQAGGRLLMPNGKKYVIGVFSIPAHGNVQIDRLRPEIPAELPLLGNHEIYIERSAPNGGLAVKVGDELTFETGDGALRQVKVKAIVHDVASFPFVFTQQVYAYATADTVAWLGGSADFSEVFMTVAENKTDEPHVRAVAAAVADKLEDSGRTAYFTSIFSPGRHFASDITAGLGAMMGFLGALSVLLSAFLVINTINSMINQQVRQIGVMKAVGARTRQLVVMYMTTILLFGLLSLLVAVPLAAMGAESVLKGISVYLNFRPRPFNIPTATLILQIAVAVLVPLGAGLAPVLRGSRITIREAISSYGLGSGRFGNSLVDRLVERIRGLPRPLLISLRNTFRRKTRLALTLSALVLAGAIFIAVFNLKASMAIAIDQTLGLLLSDVNIGFNQAYRMDKLEPIARSIPGVTRVEGWGQLFGEVLTADGTTSTQVLLFAPPANTQLVHATVTSGRWLLPEDQNAVVIGNHLQKVRPELKVGDSITINIDGKKSDWVIVGTYKMAGNVNPPPVYVNYEYLMHTIGAIGRVYSIRVLTEQHDLAYQQQVARALEAAYSAAGLQISGVQTGVEISQQNTSQTDILVYFLLVMAVLIAVVGGLGLTSTMSINVIERTREIGVMRAIGASNASIQSIVIVEGMVIGILSWIVGAILAVPVGMAVGNVVGVAFLQTPLDFAFALDGFLAWLAMVLVISAVASYLPARNASRLTVREVLAYE